MKRRTHVIVATRHPGALEALTEAEAEFPLQRIEAVTTDGFYRSLAGVHLAVVDVDSLVESPAVPRQRLRRVLEEGSLVVAEGDDFAADPSRYLDQARAASGLTEALPARTVAFAGLSGGVGKTTLSLSVARYFRRKTGLPAAVVELSFGPSGFLSLVGSGDADAHLYEVITQSKSWPTWERLTLAPMDWGTARLLAQEDVEAAWRAIQRDHVLTIFDGLVCHPLWTVAENLLDRTFVVSDGRPDALANAVYLATEEDEYAVLLNRAGAIAKLALEQPPVARLPDVGRSAARYPDKLGKSLMPVIYPGWRKR